MSEKGRITPYKFKGKEAYGASFHHPLLKKRVTRGLSTQLKYAAERITHSLEILCKNPGWTLTDANSHDIDPRAWNIFHKENIDKKPGNFVLPDMIDIIAETHPKMSRSDILAAMPLIASGGKTCYEFIDAIPILSDFLKAIECSKKEHILDVFKRFLEFSGTKINELVLEVYFAEIDKKDAIKENEEIRARLREIEARSSSSSHPKRGKAKGKSGKGAAAK